MLYLMAAALAQSATPPARPMRLADCKPLLSLASATREAPQRRDGSPPKRPKPCTVLASA